MAIPGHEQGMEIEELTARAGVSERLVRHCEAHGLISHAGQRDMPWPGYSQEDVCVLRFIRQAHVLGFGMNEAARLLAVWQEMHGPSSALDDTTAAGAMKSRTRIDEHNPLAAFVERLANALLAEPLADCSILEGMLALGARTGLVEIRAA